MCITTACFFLRLQFHQCTMFQKCSFWCSFLTPSLPNVHTSAPFARPYTTENVLIVACSYWALLHTTYTNRLIWSTVGEEGINDLLIPLWSDVQNCPLIQIQISINYLMDRKKSISQILGIDTPLIGLMVSRTYIITSSRLIDLSRLGCNFLKPSCNNSPLIATNWLKQEKD